MDDGTGSSQRRSDDERSELKVIWIQDGIVKFVGRTRAEQRRRQSACVRLSLPDPSSTAYMFDCLLAGTFQEYRLGTVVRVIVYDDLRRFLGAAQCRWRKGYIEGATGACP
jgi:hypothetical protein